jgi:hypothetical protein
LARRRPPRLGHEGAQPSNLVEGLPPASEPAADVAGGSLRTRDVAIALDLPLTRNDIQNLRAKLKRLAGRGILVGGVHDGIAQMFKVIEYARMLVGAKAIETLSTGYLNALAYAKERVQGPDLKQALDRSAPRVEIIRHPDVRRMLMLMKSQAEAMRVVPGVVGSTLAAARQKLATFNLPFTVLGVGAVTVTPGSTLPDSSTTAPKTSGPANAAARTFLTVPFMIRISVINPFVEASKRPTPITRKLFKITIS